MRPSRMSTQVECFGFRQSMQVLKLKCSGHPRTTDAQSAAVSSSPAVRMTSAPNNKTPRKSGGFHQGIPPA